MPVERYQSGQIQQGGAPAVPSSVRMLPSKSYIAVTQAGRELQAVGDKSTRALIARDQELQERKDRAAAKDAFTRFTDTLRDLDGDLRERKNRDAIGATEEATKKIDEWVLSTFEELENDRQRELFKSLAQTRRTSFLDSVATYEANEFANWEKTSAKAMIAEGIQYAAENPSDPAAMESSLTNIDIAVDTLTKGMDPDTKSSVKEAYVSDMHQAIINRLSVHDAAAAKRHYEKHKEFIDGTIRVGIEEKLKTVGVQQRAQEKTDEIWAAGGDFEGMLTEARKIKDPAVRDDVVTRLKSREQERKYIAAEEKQARLDKAAADIIQMKALNLPYEDAQNRARRVVEGGEQFNLLQMVDRLWLKQEGITNTGKYLEAMNRIDKQPGTQPITTREQLYRDYMPHLSSTDFAKLESYWQNQGAAAGLTVAQVQRLYEGVVGKSIKKHKALQEEFNKVWEFVTSNQPKDRRATDEELRKLVIQGITMGEHIDGGFKGWWDPDMTYLEAVEKGVQDQWLPKVTNEEERQIRKTFKHWNDTHGPDEQIPITEKKIREHKKYGILGFPKPKKRR